MSSNLVLSREVYSPIDTVWDYHTELERAGEYWANLSECRRLGRGPLEVGSRYAWTYNMLGRRFTGEFVITEMRPHELLAFETSRGIRARFRYQYRATARTRTRITVIVDYEVPGLLARAANALFVERRNAADAEHTMDQLKEHLEAEAMARIDASVR